MSTDKAQGVIAYIKKNTVLILLLFVGVILLLIPGRSSPAESEALHTEQESRLQMTLMQMEGVGRTYVLLAEKGNREGGFTGAVIVCEGAHEPAVRLRVISAVSAYTGLGTDKILVQKMTS